MVVELILDGKRFLGGDKNEGETGVPDFGITCWIGKPQAAGLKADGLWNPVCRPWELMKKGGSQPLFPE